jgi:pre-rRNA-processing protein TSR4
MTSQGLGTIPTCNSCGEKRVFELQLMPALVSLLKIDDERHKTTSLNDNKDNTDTQKTDFKNLSSQCIEFGTVFVYTCSQGCWSEDDAMFLEEYVIVHGDPDQHLFKNAK